MSGGIKTAPERWDWKSIVAGLDAEARYQVEERAAIHEFDGGLSRVEAEKRAAREAGLFLL